MKFEKKASFLSSLSRNIATLLIAIIIALIIRTFLIEAYKIPTGSMIPTLNKGDHILVNKFIYGVRIPILSIKLPGFQRPNRGDIIVFHYPKYKSPGIMTELVDFMTLGLLRLTNTENNPRNFIKRIIGQPGDILFSQDDQFQINQQTLQVDNHINDKFWQSLKQITTSNTAFIALQGSNDADSVNYYYKDKNNKVFSRDGFYQIFEETIDERIHLIQKQVFSSYENLPPIYVPKKNDTLTLRLEKNNTLILSVNDKIIHKTDLNQFFISTPSNLGYSMWTKFKYHRLLNESLFNLDNSNRQLQPGDLKLILQKEGLFQHQFIHNHYFMMGDNRNNSSDSRDWGFINENDIIGKPIFIYWPWHRQGSILQEAIGNEVVTLS